MTNEWIDFLLKDKQVLAYVISGWLGLIFVTTYTLISGPGKPKWHDAVSFFAYLILVAYVAVQADTAPIVAFMSGVCTPLIWPAAHKAILAAAPTVVRWYIGRNLPPGVVLPPDKVLLESIPGLPLVVIVPAKPLAQLSAPEGSGEVEKK